MSIIGCNFIVSLANKSNSSMAYAYTNVQRKFRNKCQMYKLFYKKKTVDYDVMHPKILQYLAATVFELIAPSFPGIWQSNKITQISRKKIVNTTF